MKQMIIAFILCGGLIAGCDSNKRSSKSSGRRHSTTAYKPASAKQQTTTATISSEDSIKIAAKTREEASLDSLLKTQENASQRPGLYFNGSMGPGTGGSYASSAYRHNEMNKRRYAEKALAKKKEQMKLNQNVETLVVQDSITAEADSTQSTW